MGNTHIMIRKFIRLFFIGICSVVSVAGQSIDTKNFAPSGDSLRGNLLFVSETHDVRTNQAEYYEVIKSITADFKSIDTLNIILEAPYSMTCFMNKYLRGESRALIDSILRNDPDKIEYFFSLKKLQKNIRFIGVDFEYDHGNPGARLESYKAFFDDLKKELEKNKVDLSVIRSFIYGIRVQGLEEADIYTFRKYVQKLRINQPDSTLRVKLKEANFILTARADWDKDDMRDKVCYGRLTELLSSGTDFKSNHNIIIYGSAHGSPVNEKSIYYRLNYQEDSPFFSKVYFLANIYYGCLSTGSYYDRHFSIETNGPYFYTKEDTELLAFLKKSFDITQENSLVIYKNNLSSTLKDFGRIWYFAIHNKVK